MGFAARLRWALPVLVACGPTRPARLAHAYNDPFATAFGGASALAEAAPAGKMTLGEAYKLALARSDRVSAADHAAWEQQIHARETYNILTPTINVTGTAIYQRERTVGTTQQVIVPGNELLGALNVAQPVLRPGFFPQTDADQRSIDSADQSAKRSREQIAHDLVDAFIGVLRARSLLELSHAAVARAKTQYDLAVGRVKAGQALHNVELLAQIDLQRAQLQEAVALRDTAIAGAAFQRIVGREPPAELVLPATPALPTQDQALAYAQNRSDLKSLELQVEKARAMVDSTANKRWRPTLDVDAMVQLNYPKLYIPGRYLDYQVLGLLTIPLLQNGHEFTDLALRENDQNVAELQLEGERKIAYEEIERAALQAASAEHVVQIATELVGVAREHYKLVDKQVRLGAITFLEVTNAQAVLVEAENAFEVAKMDRETAVYDYLFAIGALDLMSASGVAKAR